MLWRIGDILDFDAQLAWTRAAGFDGAGFHASAGAPGRWRGIEPARATSDRRRSLRDDLSIFSFAEIHAPFAVELTSEDLAEQINALGPVLELAGDLRASVVTVHAQIHDSDAQDDAWLAGMRDLDHQAARAQTTIGLEIVDGFQAVRAWDLPRIGVTLDVGHMYAPAHSPTLTRFNGLGNLIGYLGPALVHLHLHDTDGETDHCEVGTGIVDFSDIAIGLEDASYARGATLEMNPDRCSPEGIVRSAERLRGLFGGASTR
jgi:sugar phosphate isomerase/epimerase